MLLSEKFFALGTTVEGVEAKLAEAEDDGGYTSDSVAYLKQTLTDAGVMFDGVADSVGPALRAAEEGLTLVKEEPTPQGGVLTCALKSVLAKVAKTFPIPFGWTGTGFPTFVSSNPAVCLVTPDGTLVPVKAGVAAITISAPGNSDVIFTVTVTA